MDLPNKLLELENRDKVGDLKKIFNDPTRLYTDFAQDAVILVSAQDLLISGGGIVDNLPEFSLKALQQKSNWILGIP